MLNTHLFDMVAASGSHSPDVIAAKLGRNIKMCYYLFIQGKNFIHVATNISYILQETINDMLSCNWLTYMLIVSMSELI